MQNLKTYIASITDEEQRIYVSNIVTWVAQTFPQLEVKIAWNQPMFTNHGTYIIGFSVAKHHIAIAPEIKGMQMFSTQIDNADYKQSTHLFKMKWSDPIDYDLLKQIIQFNIDDKAGYSSFWRT